MGNIVSEKAKGVEKFQRHVTQLNQLLNNTLAEQMLHE